MILAIAVYPELPSLQAEAERLAARLHLPFILRQEEGYDYFLTLTPDYLGLQKRGSESVPLYVDFLRGKMNYRAQHTSIKHEALARAMGLKGRTHPRIVDATGGLAGDAFTLASLGFDVILLERSPIIYALVADGLKRAQNDSRARRIQLIFADAMAWLTHLKRQDQPDIVYLDPMFPERKKSALPKQEMLILQDVVGSDADAKMLLEVALACALKRVVVKRPRLAERLAESPVPSFSLSGSSSRFDVYVR